MPQARKRAATKARKGTAGARKTAQRKSTQAKARTKTSGRVKGARGGPATRTHPQSTPTKRASSRRSAATKPARDAAHAPYADISEADEKRIPSMSRVRAKDRGE